MKSEEIEKGKIILLLAALVIASLVINQWQKPGVFLQSVDRISAPSISPVGQAYSEALRRQEAAEQLPREITVGHEWVGVALPRGWIMDATWTKDGVTAPLDVRINHGTIKILPGDKGDYGNQVSYLEWRLNPDSNASVAKVTCKWTKIP